MDGSNLHGVFDYNLLKLESRFIIQNLATFPSWKKTNFKRGLDKLHSDFMLAKKNNLDWATGERTGQGARWGAEVDEQGLYEEVGLGMVLEKSPPLGGLFPRYFPVSSEARPW